MSRPASRRGPTRGAGTTAARWPRGSPCSPRWRWASSIAIMALTAFVVMRQQLMSSLDQSLLNRAHKATAVSTLSRAHRPTGCPPWVLGAADVRVIFVTADGAPSGDRHPELHARRSPEYDVVTGQRDSVVRTLVTEEGERFRVGDRAGRQRAGPDPRPAARHQRPDAREARRRALRLRRARRAGRRCWPAGWSPATACRPVRRLTSAVERIAVTEDLTPLRVEGDDEVARLATAFNQMLLALGASRDRQRRLVADASHELRTPLTSLRTNLDLLRQAEGNTALPPEARLELLDDVRGQIEELSALVGDLVELARDEPTTHVVARGRPRRGGRAGGDARTPSRPRRPLRRRPRPVAGRRRRQRPRAGGHQPPRQRRQVEPRRRDRHRAAGRRRARRRRRGPRHRRGRPPARLRAVLPLRGVARDARLGARAWRSCAR